MRMCLLASGSNGNACLVEAGPQRLLIDVGIGPRVLAARLRPLGLSPTDLTDVWLTHEHSDHVRGLAPLLGRHPGLRVHATGGTRAALPSTVARHVRRVSADREFMAGALRGRPFAVSHDAREPVGYRVEHDGGSLGYATDLGFFDATVAERLAGVDVLVVESNHCPNRLARGPYPAYLKRRVAGPQGHLSNPQTRSLLTELMHPGLRFAALAHLSGENNTPDAVRQALADVLEPLGPDGWAVGRRDGALDPVRWDAAGSVQRGGQLRLPW